jgi:hypothetical protein
MLHMLKARCNGRVIWTMKDGIVMVMAMRKWYGFERLKWFVLY